MKINQKGFAHLGLILAIIVVLGIVGFAGYRVGIRDKKSEAESTQPASDSSSENDSQSQEPAATNIDTAPPEDLTKDWTLVAPKNTDGTFIVKVPETLLPEGSCKTKVVLLGIIYNSDSYDYDCSDVMGALSYATIVFGTSTESVVSLFGTPQNTDEVTLADGNSATKSVVTAQAKSGGGTYTARYVIYETTSKETGNVYYAVYNTGVDFSDEDKFLNDFEAVVTKGWAVP